jgi:PAS domain S-box-containing protein
MVHVIDRHSSAPASKIGILGERVANQGAEDLSRCSLFDQAPFGYLVIDTNGRISAVNQAAATALNAPQSTLLGQAFMNFIHRDDQGHYRRRLENCPAASSGISLEIMIKPFDGDCFDACLQMRSGKDPVSGAIEFRTAFIDSSDKALLGRNALQLECLELGRDCREIQTLLKAYVRRLKAFLQCRSVGIRITVANGPSPIVAHEGFPPGYLSVETDRALESDQNLLQPILTGAEGYADTIRSPQGSLYLNTASGFLDDVPPNELAALREITVAHGYESVVLTPVEFDGEILGLLYAADRRRQWFPLRVVQTLEAVASQLGCAADRFRLQEELLASVSSLKDLSSHLLTVHENGQQRIAMELHDGCGQDLNALKLRLRGIQKRLPPDATALRDECEMLLSHSDKIINDIRAIAHDLKPAALDALGLVVATGQMIREFSSLSGIQVEANITALQAVKDPMVQLSLFRIFQEALNNIQKHAQATWVLIAATHGGRKMRITIRDNGKGFETTAPPDQTPQAKGLGLSTMALRCRMMGGQLDIQSTLGRGTQVSVFLPCSNNGEGSR